MRILYRSGTYCCYSYHTIFVRETLTFVILERFLRTLLKVVVTETLIKCSNIAYVYLHNSTEIVA